MRTHTHKRTRTPNLSSHAAARPLPQRPVWLSSAPPPPPSRRLRRRGRTRACTRARLQVLRFGSAVTLRASAGLTFPRQLPIDWDAEGEAAPFGLRVHRLSLKSVW